VRGATIDHPADTARCRMADVAHQRPPPRLSHDVGRAAVYAFRRPDPLPRVFGYHELFHGLTNVALACQYVAVGVFVVGVG